MHAAKALPFTQHICAAVMEPGAKALNHRVRMLQACLSRPSAALRAVSCLPYAAAMAAASIVSKHSRSAVDVAHPAWLTCG